MIFLDAMWKYASDMENKNTELGIWPSVLIRVKLVPDRKRFDGASGETKRNRDRAHRWREGMVWRRDGGWERT